MRNDAYNLGVMGHLGLPQPGLSQLADAPSRWRRFQFGCLVAALALLCLPQARAQVDLNSARITELAGQVSLERGSELWVLQPGAEIGLGHVIVTGSDGYASMNLPDGSTMEFFPNTRFVFRANRFNWRDLIDLYIGKVRFHIQKLTRDDTPIRVTSPTAVISVRGTVFEVEVDAVNDTLVYVESGAVGVRHRLFAGEEVLVETGQTMQVIGSAPLTPPQATVPFRAIGRVVRAIGDTLAQVSASRGGNGPGEAGGDAGGASSGGSASGSDSGSNEEAPVPGEDGQGSAPPGDVIP